MAALTVRQLRQTLNAFAVLYVNAGATEAGTALVDLSKALAKADKLAVDDLVEALGKGGDAPASDRKCAEKH